MKPARLIVLTFCLFFFLLGDLYAKNVLTQILGAYQKYQEINMTLWLVGDVGAEKRFGKELQFWMGLTYKEEKDPKIRNYVKGIFDRLVPHFNNRGMKFDVKVVRNSTANAFVIPGGHVYVFTGLLDMVKSDDELAAVISHELGHAERRHSLQNFRASTIAVALLNKAVKNKQDRETWGALLSYLTLMKFSRQQEDEADDIGQFRMAKAGYNPAAQVTLWEKFLKKFGDSKGLEQYLSSHPPSSQRVENARNNLKKMNVTEQKVFSNTRNILSAERINLLANPSFETEPGNRSPAPGWETIEGSAYIVEANAKTGRRSLNLKSDQRMSATRVVSDFIAVSEKSDLIFSGWARSADGKVNAAVGIELYDANKRLRNRLWSIRESSPLSENWTKLEARLANINDRKIFAANNSFIRIVLQTGLVSQGETWFDDFRLRPAAAVDSINLLTGGDFETLQNGIPEGIIAGAGNAGLDYGRSFSGYASLRIKAVASGETGFSFEPIALGSLKPSQDLNCSFHFQADQPVKGLIIAEYVDEAGRPLARRLLQAEFEAVSGNWQATSFSFRHEPQKDEQGVAKALVIRLATNMPAGSSLWLDGFVMR